VAVATKGSRGLDDEVAEVFGRAKTFTIVEIEDGQIKSTKVVENPAASYEFGAGPIAIKTLADMGVEIAVGAEFGVGVLTLLKDKNIRAVRMEAGTNVSRAVGSAINRKE